ncbi:toxin-antitoxin system, toxin component, MazF family protein [Streptococcus pluranimalium]|uniref:toxin-antitoxin system, toxin component, MazF family protein n=1 Tax=Streptococcus pluranimalium TaxID=82348 RepID=UPI003F691D1D
MADLECYKLLVATIEYTDGTGSKTRPEMVITLNKEVIKVLRLTSLFDKIRKQGIFYVLRSSSLEH